MILLFGGGGQLGQELQRSARTQDIALRALDRSQADIPDADAVERAVTETKPSLCVNAAAYTKVDLAETEVEAARRANEVGPGVIATACAKAGIPLVHISTDYVFDGKKVSAYVETDPISPVGQYARTKAAGEGAVRQNLPRHLILRTGWVYGEFGHNFLKTMVRLAQERDEVRIVADQHGCPTSTRDLARAILQSAKALIAGDPVWGTYHFVGAGETTWHGFAERIFVAQSLYTGRRPRAVPITTAEYPTAAARPANSVLNSTRFATAFGIRARPWVDETDVVTAAVVKSL
jgi:dTDP-4-dehydrorhamnose reductase